MPRPSRQPACTNDGHAACCFLPAQKFKTRYATPGLSDRANLDEGTMWPTYFAATALTRRRRGKDRRAGEEGRELRTEAAAEAAVARARPRTRGCTLAITE